MKIITDSAADLTPEDIAAHQISVAPLYIQFPGREIKAEDITPDDFYNQLEAMQPNTPTTAQPAPENFTSLYRDVLESEEKALSLHISSGLSGTFNAARVGASQFDPGEVQIVDTLTLSGGQRFQVLAAARAIQAGWPLDVILKQLDKIRQETEVIYTLDTLDYLARGGRIGRVQALASSLLNIKPLIKVEKTDGKYSTVGKSRTISRAINDLAKHLSELYEKQPVWVSVVHGRFEEKAQQLADKLRSDLNIAKLEILRISPVLGVHTGPGIVGATVVPIKLIEEIQ